MSAIGTCRVLRPDPGSIDRREQHHRAIFSACHLSGTTVLVTVRGEVDATNGRALAGYVERQVAGSTRLVLDLAVDRFLRHRRLRGPAQRQRDLRPIRGLVGAGRRTTGATLPPDLRSR